MERHIFTKLESPGGHLEAKDLTADEKRGLYTLMGKYGLPESTTYNRFFDKGFDPWEMAGINQCKTDFVETVENEAIKNILYGTDDGFYSALPEGSGYRMRLVSHMAERGMVHRATVEKRFDADDWKEWERRGVRAVIDEFCNLYAEKKETA